jgi:cytochrome oxidase Cu insertion factor (SCO1/SenC/PrrC family)
VDAAPEATDDVGGWRLSEGWTLLGIALLVGFAWTGRLSISHDVAYLSEVGDRLVAGQVPYVDYMETNPPLSHYLHGVAAWLAGPPGAATVWMTIALTLVGTIAAAGAIGVGLEPLAGRRPARRAMAAFVAVSVFVAAVGNFAQREQLFVLLFAPYLVVRLRQVARMPVAPGLAVLAGMAGAIGVCIKPHFLVTAGLVELGLIGIVRTDWRRFVGPGLVAWILTGLAYPVHFLLVPESMQTAFFDVWVPVLVDGYRAYGAPEVAYVTLWPVWVPVGLAALVGAGLAAAVPAERRLVRLGTGLAAVGGFVVYFLQWKGWFYHLIPAQSFAAVCLALAVGDAMTNRLRVGLVRFSAGWMALIVVVVLVRGNAVPDGGEGRAMYDAHVETGDTVLVWTSDLPPAYPWLTLKDVRPIGRYLVAFPLPVLFPDGVEAFSEEPATEAERLFRRHLAEDLDLQPDWLLVDTDEPCLHCGPGVDFRGYLEAVGLWERVEREYVQIDAVPGLSLWGRRSEEAMKAAEEPDWRAMLKSWRHPEGLPDLPFVDGSGQPFSLSELSDDWLLMGFVFTRCGNQEACPLTMQQMRSVQLAWKEDDPPLQLLTITIDPAYDTPERLTAYAERFGRTEGPPRWTVATGDAEMIDEALPQLFNLLVLPEGGTLTHTVKLALLRPGLELEAEWEGAVGAEAILERMRGE